MLEMQTNRSIFFNYSLKKIYILNEAECLEIYKKFRRIYNCGQHKLYGIVLCRDMCFATIIYNNTKEETRHNVQMWSTV